MDTDLLPGDDLVRQGLRDLSEGRRSVPALLVSIGSNRLRRAGLTVPAPLPDPDQGLYLALRERYGDDAYSRYNSLVRRLVSFERALECAS